MRERLQKKHEQLEKATAEILHLYEIIADAKTLNATHYNLTYEKHQAIANHIKNLWEYAEELQAPSKREDYHKEYYIKNREKILGINRAYAKKKREEMVNLKKMVASSELK